jgi:hypothetical protein
MIGRWMGLTRGQVKPPIAPPQGYVDQPNVDPPEDPQNASYAEEDEDGAWHHDRHGAWNDDRNSDQQCKGQDGILSTLNVARHAGV